MAFIEWKNEYSVAVKKFNDDHMKLFSYINDLDRGLSSGLGISEMSYILQGLVDYTILHFKNEEKLMKKYNYPDYDSHKQEHDELIEKVTDFFNDFKDGRKTFSIQLLIFLNDWITNHILKTDMKYKPFFKQIAAMQKEE